MKRELVLLLCALLSGAAARSTKATDHHKLLLVSTDGLRWDYADRVADLEGFQRLIKNGVRAQYLKPAFPSQTSPCHFTIATGLHPESHGVVHNCNYDKNQTGLWSRSNFYSTLAVNEWWDNGAEPIWITAVKQGLRSGGNLFPGSAANMSGIGATIQVLETAQTPKDEQDWRDRIDQTMRWFTEENLDMVALYFEEPDITSHDAGPDSHEVTDVVLPLVDRTIGYLLDRIDEVGLADHLNVIFVSDHGFQQVASGNEQISLLNYTNMQEDVDFMFTYAPIALIEPKAGKLETVYAALKEASVTEPMSVYKKEDLPERWHYKNNDRVTSIVVVADAGYVLYPRELPFTINQGEHGYDNNLKSMRASYFSIGPSFKKNYVIDGFESVHIYPLMCHLLGLDPAPNNGSLDVLAKTLDNAAVSFLPSKATLLVLFVITFVATA